MTIGERIKQRRLELGLTQEELAKRIGNKTRAAVCRVEKDKEDLTSERIRKYADALECTPAFLVGWEEEKEQAAKDMLVNAYLKGKETRTLVELYHNAPNDIKAVVMTLLKSVQKGDEQ